MMSRLMLLGGVIGLLVAQSGSAQEPKSSDAAQAAYKILAQSEGEWDADLTVNFPGPDGKPAPAKSKGVETNRMLGGKWLISDFKGEFFNTPFEGHGQNGYDSKKGKYVATWIDSVASHIDFMEGTYDEKTKTLTLNADTEEPASGKPMKMRLETQFKDENTRLFTEYLQVEGQKEFTKFLEVTYTRRKK
jgi:hypothetical protein